MPIYTLRASHPRVTFDIDLNLHLPSHFSDEPPYLIHRKPGVEMPLAWSYDPCIAVRPLFIRKLIQNRLSLLYRDDITHLGVEEAQTAAVCP